ncbi:MAG: xanthine dehydrogenase family protein molybdopterin-binding subunit [Chromatiales bacterium]|nr:xanthine dehydrogenase family protein molybdopterin-binding subunit [Chromatiales bacterium]
MTMHRRDFLTGALAVSGGLVLAVGLPGCGRKPAATGPAAPVDLNAWLQVGTDGTVRFWCDRSEMGQGVYTALPMLIAEELGVAPEAIRVEFAPAGEQFTNNLLGTQITGGSTSVRDAWVKLRTAGAQAREMLVAAAAAEWGVAPGDCRVEGGSVVAPDGGRLPYAAVAEAAGRLPVPQDVALKPASAFTVIGRPQRRLDTGAKVDGSAVYGIDVRLDGLLHGALAQPPTLGGRVRSFDATAAKAMPGVRDVVQTSTGIVVVANTWWRARKARDALRIEWDPGPNSALDTDAVMRGLRAAASAEGQVARNDGDAPAAIAAARRGAGGLVSAGYELPLLAHATLEPQNCTAVVTADGCDVYVPTQTQLIARATAAAAAGLPPEKVRVHTTFLGGGFGRRLEVDFIPAAVEASKAVGAPVKVLWTREDDTTHDAYRPPAFNRVSAVLGADGRPTAWHLHLTSPSITARMFPAAVENAVDPFAIEAATNYPYDVPNVRVTYNRHEIGIDVGYWRSVSHALNCFVAESFMDELAAAAGRDPVAYRLALLDRQPRFAAVLRRAADEAGWAMPPAGHSLGVALMEGYGTYMAMVADVTVEDGRLKVHALHCALDCGQAVNPDTVVAQVESSVVFGLSAALWGRIDLKDGQVQQRNFDTYRVLRLPELPRIVTYVLDSTAEPGGIGEPATALVAPAVANAVYRATERRLRSLPLSLHGIA